MTRVRPRRGRRFIARGGPAAPGSRAENSLPARPVPSGAEACGRRRIPTRGKMPLANNRDPSGVKPRGSSLSTGRKNREVVSRPFQSDRLWPTYRALIRIVRSSHSCPSRSLLPSSQSGSHASARLHSQYDPGEWRIVRPGTSLLHRVLHRLLTEQRSGQPACRGPLVVNLIKKASSPSVRPRLPSSCTGAWGPEVDPVVPSMSCGHKFPRLDVEGSNPSPALAYDGKASKR